MRDPLSALSALPRSRRPLLDLEPVGREEDLEWVRSTPGDLVLAGEPGSGKTFLLAHLIRQGWNGLFLVDDERGEVKRALLERRPAAVIVDDAHVRPETLGMLRHLRAEMGAHFSVVATTWTWERDLEAVTAALPDARKRELRLLPRHQILELFEQAGVRGPDALLRELVDQAANKPGLAATIAHLWKSGHWQEVLEGKVLHRETLAAFGPAGEDVEDLLAALSLGGDPGMGREPVRTFLGLSEPALRRKTAALAAGGVIGVEQDGALSVSPRQLRTSLLRTVFFPDSGQGCDYRPLLGEVPSFAHAVQEIARVHQSGDRAPEIRELVQQAGHDEESARTAWRLLAGAGENDARWVLESYPGDLLNVAPALLELIPGETIPRLLDRAAEEVRARRWHSEAMHLLSTWIQEPYPLQWDEALRRRELVARSARRFLENGGDLGTGVHGLCLALKPGQAGSSRDPGLGNTVKLWSALLPLPGLRQIAPVWKGVKDAIPRLDRVSWQHVRSALADWIHPSYAARGGTVPADVEEEMRGFAARVLGDLVPLAQTSPGLRAGLARLASQLGRPLEVELDAVFELLYPESYAESEPDRKAAREVALRALADQWALLGSQGMARRLAWYEAEAERIGYSWPRGSQYLCRLLAERADDPRSWLEALLQNRLASMFVSPFLDRIIQERHEGWEEVADRCLDLDDYQFAAIDAILQFADPSTYLLSKALDHAADWIMAVESLASCRKLPPENLRAALRHPDVDVALAVAVGEWNAEEVGDVRDDLRDDWRAAILRAPAEGRDTSLQHWLGVILAQDADLALDWLRARLHDPEPARYFLDGPFVLAVGALSLEQRAQLLDELPPLPILDSLLPRLIGQDASLYRQLLARPDLWDYHLSPLGGKPNDSWSDLAALALEAGHSPEEIARATTWPPGGRTLVGSGVDYWESWMQAFAAFEMDPRGEIREVARQGRELVEHELQAARLEQKRIDLRGLW